MSCACEQDVNMWNKHGGETHCAHVMISGNVGIAVMPRENPIRPSMRTSNHN